MAGRRRDIHDLPGEIQELFADLWQVPRFSRLRHGFRPQCDAFRTEDPPALHVVAELAGAAPETIQVVVSGRSLIVAGTRERPHTAGAHYDALEIEYGDFQRRLELGEHVDPALASATYERGLLRIVLPIAAADGPAESSERVAIEVQLR